jgi:ComF family protein
MKLTDWLLDLLFPPKCPFCGAVQDHTGICPDCRRELPWTEDPDQVRQLPGNLRCVAPLWYEDRAREGLLRLKFSGAAAGAGPMGALIAASAAERLSGEFDTVTWVPVSKKRLRRRGYDQARLLAEGACRCWDTKPVALLRKTVDNPAQSGLADAAARRANVLGVYEADAEAVRGRRVLLVDDIVTTGATLCECARVLTDAGAESVVCAAVARTHQKERAPEGKRGQNT